jgi:glycosyltransferase involved in cell wall biosynthesis
MKILYYNWVDFEDPQKRGGGVTVYQKNLVDAALAQGDEIHFLSSGIAYTPFGGRPFVAKVRGGNQSVRKYEIVNSPILSPGHLSFQQDIAAHPAMEEVFSRFLQEHGPFDVAHFNNLEGIPASFLSVARQHAAKVIFSLHNYFAFCPQVNLWFQEKANCVDYCSGRKCVHCLPELPNTAAARREYMIQTSLKRLGVQNGTWLVDRYIRPAYRLAKGVGRRLKRVAGVVGRHKTAAAAQELRLLDKAQAEHYVWRRATFVQALNEHVDRVHAVSDRVAELAVRFGVNPDKVETAYIGTRFAKVQASARDVRTDGKLAIGFLGYMRRDKGFYFLLAALERMPKTLAAQLAVTVAAKLTDHGALWRLRRIAHKFDAVTLVDGYSHATLPKILEGIDLGIVPVLWEDNLPQVAIEFVGSGIPVLCADLGGAKEVLDCPALTFEAGSRADFYAKLRGLLDQPSLLRRALAGRRKLFTPQEHYEILKDRFYARHLAVDAVTRLAA